MFVNPFSPASEYRAIAIAAACAVVLAGAFGSGWAVNGWRKDSAIADLKREKAEDATKQTRIALDNLIEATNLMHAAAKGAQVDMSALGQKLDDIKKEFKNAKPVPLPADCKLDDVRLRNLKDAAAAVNESALGLKPSERLRAAPSP